MTMAETNELDAMAQAASERRDFHAVKRITRFLGMDLPRSSRKTRATDDFADDIDDAEILELLQMVLKDMPKGAWFKAGLHMELGEAGLTLPGWTMAP